MRCSVQNCTNNTKRQAKTKGITFHFFPREPSLRQAWIEALGVAEWEPKDHSTICSEHFSSEDYYETKCGSRKIKNGAVPVLGLGLEDLDAPACNAVCRICLAMDMKMYGMKDYQLGERYHQVTGIMWSENDGLPQKFCWECTGRLLSSYKLFKKALLSHKMMMSVLQSSTYIKVKDVKSINRSYNDLLSNLIQKNYETNKCDLHLQDDSEAVYQESVEEELVKERSLEKCIAVPLNSEDIPPLMTVEVKYVQGDDFFIGSDDSFDVSDDNLKLSEVVERPERVEKKSKVKKKKVNVQRERKMVQRLRKDEEENPTSTMDKYKTADDKRRKTSDGLDESLFNISALSYQEQIAEIQKRQEATAYKNALYKCTACYRGFQIKERYKAHIVRHSDQIGAYECFICKTRMRTERALRKHITGLHTKKFSCKECPFVTRIRGVARGHEKWHAGTKYQCPHCSSEFDKVSTYLGHIRIKHVSDFVCELCGYTFVSKKGIDMHKNRIHRLADKTVPLEGPYCCVCNVTFVSEEAHARHLELSSKHSRDSDPNRIRNESRSFNTERNGRVRRKIERRPVIHPRDPSDRDRRPDQGGPVTCEQCGIQLRDNRLYAHHFRRAHPDKNRTKYPAMKSPCMCEQCGRIFHSMALLRDHMWVHTGEKGFICDLCKKSFTLKTNLVVHMKVHSASRPSYECPVCGKYFAFFNNLKRHMFIHTGQKPFKCDTCGKMFTTSREQRSHVEHVHLKKPWPKRARGKKQSCDMGESD